MPLSLDQKGFNYVSYYNGGYENANSLSDLAATGANSVELATEIGIDTTTSTVYSDHNYSESALALGATIDQAKALGLAVTVRPLIDFLDPSKIGANGVGDWRSYFNPANPAAFFASYKAMILSEARVAQAHGAAALCIGTEIDQLTGPQYLSYWSDIISSVRAVFSGKLTYAADWNDDVSPWSGHNGLQAGTGNLATQVSFWNQLDAVGIDAYPALSDAANPTEAQLVAGWTHVPTDGGTRAVTGNQSLISYFQGVGASIGKPLLFTEIGYESATDAAAEPAGSSTGVFDPGLQASLYQAFFDAWGQNGNGTLKGAYFWNWDPNAGEVGPGNGANFSPQGLAAEEVVKANFGSPDTTPPTLAFTSVAYTDSGVVGDGVTAIASVTLSGTVADAGGVAGVEVYDGGSDLGAAVITGGTWSLSATLADGVHAAFSAIATDAAGNTTKATIGTSLTIDTTPPALAFTSVAYADSGVVGDGVTAIASVMLSGSVADAGGVAGVEVYDGGTDLGAAAITGGTWSLSATLADGVHAGFSAIATDAAGNTTKATNGTSLTIDTAPPALAFTSVAYADSGVVGDGVTAIASVTLSGTVADNGGVAGVEVYDGGTDLGAAVITGGTWSLSATLADGVHAAFSAIATDDAGNTTKATNGTSLTIDTAPPALAFTSVVYTDSGVVGDGVTAIASVTLSGTVADNGGVAGVEVYDGGTDLGAAVITGGTWSLSATLADGVHAAFSALAIDAAGNTTKATIGTSLTIDTAPPALAFTSVAYADSGVVGDGVTAIASVTLSGTVADNGGVAGVEVYDGGTDLGAAAITSGTWSLSATLADGVHAAFSAIATDEAGNTTKATNGTSLTIDTAPPALAFTSVASTDSGVVGDGVTAIASVTLSGSVADNGGVARVEVYDGGSDLGAAVITEGTWSLSATLADGVHAAFSALAIDEAGNTTKATNGTSLTIDTTPPSLVITSPGETSSTASQALSGRITSGGGASVAGIVVTFTDNGAALATTGTVVTDADGYFNAAFTLPDLGANAIVASATDSAGNLGTSGPVTETLTQDPGPTGGSGGSSTIVPSPGLTVDSGVTFTKAMAVTMTGTASDAAGLGSVEFYAGSTDLGSATLRSDGSFAFTHHFGPGTHTDLFAVATDTLGATTTTPADFDITTGIKRAPYVAEIDTYDANGNSTGFSQFTKTGALYLAATIATLPNGDMSVFYSGGSVFDHLGYGAYQDITTTDGNLAIETLFNDDGSTTITGYQDHLTLRSAIADTMTGGGHAESFVFTHGFGADTITDFHVAGQGHDTVSVSGHAFASLADVLRHTWMAGGDAVIHAPDGETITLDGVTKAQLAAHPADVKLHG